jgi:hypothetical protein
MIVTKRISPKTDRNVKRCGDWHREAFGVRGACSRFSDLEALCEPVSKARQAGRDFVTELVSETSGNNAVMRLK